VWVAVAQVLELSAEQKLAVSKLGAAQVQQYVMEQRLWPDPSLPLP
jgi:hypothetical protein